MSLGVADVVRIALFMWKWTEVLIGLVLSMQYMPIGSNRRPTFQALPIRYSWEAERRLGVRPHSLRQ